MYVARRRDTLPVLWLAMPALAGCGSPPGDVAADSCASLDPRFDDASFVTVTRPRPGEAAPPGFAVEGCSRTFESNVVWTLTARDGRELASGYATGGGADGKASFRFVVDYRAREPGIGQLRVAEPRVAEGEGFPPVEVALPLALGDSPP